MFDQPCIFCKVPVETKILNFAIFASLESKIIHCMVCSCMSKPLFFQAKHVKSILCCIFRLVMAAILFESSGSSKCEVKLACGCDFRDS